MAGMVMRIEGFAAASQRFDEVGARARMPEPAMRSDQVLAALKDGQAKKFRSRAGWRPDTPGWVAEKRRRGLDTRTMVATGQLERALTTADRSKGVVFHAYDRELRWGIKGGRTDLYYAVILARKTSTRPARKAVVVTKKTREVLAEVIARYVATGEL